MFTRSSVVWADRTVATTSSKGFSCTRAHSAGYSSARRRPTSRARPLIVRGFPIQPRNVLGGAAPLAEGPLRAYSYVVRARSWSALLLVVAVVVPALGACGCRLAGRPAPLTPADGALFGVAVAPGTREAPYQPLVDLEAQARPEGGHRPLRPPLRHRLPRRTGAGGRRRRAHPHGLLGPRRHRRGQPGQLGHPDPPAGPGGRRPQPARPDRLVRRRRQPPQQRRVAPTPASTSPPGSRIRRIFNEEDAQNAIWVWCVDAADFGNGTADAWYPGDDAVDWICADGYNPRNPGRPESLAGSFEEIFTPFHDWGVAATTSR